MKLIVISDPEVMADEAAVLTRMLTYGAYRIHIRKPSWSETDMWTLLSHIPRQFYDRLSVHSHYEAAIAAGVGGIHFTHTVTASEREGLQKIARDRGLVVSAAIHALTELDMIGEFSYVFLSPVFDSISKDIPGAFSMQDLATVIPASRTPVYALGGVRPDRVLHVRDSGFAGVGTLGYVWKSDVPVQQFLTLQKYVEGYDTSVCPDHCRL